MPAAATPHCPRCGYDQSGVVSSWQQAPTDPPSSPLTGLCSECGLGFWWGDLLVPWRQVAEWSFEHSLRRVPIGPLLRTWARAVLPWRLWRVLRLEHPISVRRLVVYAVLAVLMVHLGISAASAANVWANWSIWLWPSSFPGGLAPPESEHRLLILRAFLFPYWAVEPGVGAIPWLPTFFPYLEAPVISAVAIGSIVAALASPAAFLVLRDSMKQARVRSLHLFRAFIYSLSPIPPLSAVYFSLRTEALDGAVLGLANSLLPWPTGHHAARFVTSSPAWAFAAWLVLFWWLVPGWYLRLPHARGIALAMVVLALLTGIVAAAIASAVWPELGPF